MTEQSKSVDVDPTDLLERITVRCAMPRQLWEYWSAGPGAARIRWDTPNDMTRCIRLLTREIGRAEVAKYGGAAPICQNLYKSTHGGRSHRPSEH